MIEESRLRNFLEAFKARRILVVGDLMLDEFIWGKVSRISPEAPVPVVEVQRESRYPGGAANVARNLKRFTPHVSVMGLIGTCEMGRQLIELLRHDGIETVGVVAVESHRTIVKTRIIARQQQVVRVDRETKATPSAETYAKLLEVFEMLLPQIDAVIIEDYGKGLLSQNFVDHLVEKSRQAGKIITVDPNPTNPLEWKGVTAVKPNRSEAFAAAQILDDDAALTVEEDDSLKQVTEILLARWRTKLLLITLGENGMLLVGPDHLPYHTPTRARKVFDLSGAGDTAIALFTLALASGAQPNEAAEIANHASGVVVGKLGTETVSPEELVQSMADIS